MSVERTHKPAPHHSALNHSARPHPEPRRSERGASFADALRQYAERVAEGDRATRTALRPGRAPLDQAQLLALQAGVYRFSQEVELGSRVLDRAIGALKQVLQSQN